MTWLLKVLEVNITPMVIRERATYNFLFRQVYGLVLLIPIWFAWQYVYWKIMSM